MKSNNFIAVEYNEGIAQLGFGIIKDNKILLHAYEIKYLKEEAPHLVNNVKFNIKTINENEYKIFKFLRDNAYIVRFSLDTDIWRVYRKGFRKNEDRTRYLLKVIDKKMINSTSLLNDMALSNKMRKKLIYAFIDTDITFISLSKTKFI